MIKWFNYSTTYSIISDDKKTLTIVKVYDNGEIQKTIVKLDESSSASSTL